MGSSLLSFLCAPRSAQANKQPVPWKRPYRGRRNKDLRTPTARLWLDITAETLYSRKRGVSLRAWRMPPLSLRRSARLILVIVPQLKFFHHRVVPEEFADRVHRLY